MPATRYVALLRGINVGGKNLIGMPVLASCFEAGGFGSVSTYIQSGNVLFETARGRRDLVNEIEAMLLAAFRVPLVVVLRSHAQLAAVVAGSPRGFGKDPGRYLYDVVFLKEPLTAAAALRDIATRDGVDEVAAGKGVLYFSRLQARAAQSRLSRVASLPTYKSMTIRNWNTTTKLLALLDARAAGC
jgi:uncharacterized protein (DUF1697 family)